MALSLETNLKEDMQRELVKGLMECGILSREKGECEEENMGLNKKYVERKAEMIACEMMEWKMKLMEMEILLQKERNQEALMKRDVEKIKGQVEMKSWSWKRGNTKEIRKM